MSHHVTASGRPYVECDERAPASPQVAPDRCRRFTFGHRDRVGEGPLSILDLPAGWSVAPYRDTYDHGATRISLLDGSELEPFPHLIGLTGDLHTCPACNKRRLT